MSSETTMMAEQYRLREWADQIRDCQSRPSGIGQSSSALIWGLYFVGYYKRAKRCGIQFWYQFWYTPYMT